MRINRAVRRHRRRQRGQAIVEFTVVLPVFIAVTLGVVDLGHATDVRSIAGGEARAGLTAATQDAATTAYVGSAIRNESGNSISLNWGIGASGGAADCDSSSTQCGDTGGCAAGDSWWTSGVNACYAVGVGTINTTTQTCTLTTGWTTVTAASTPYFPSSVPSHCIAVKVVLAVTALSPTIQPFSTGGKLYMTSTATGVQLY